MRPDEPVMYREEKKETIFLPDLGAGINGCNLVVSPFDTASEGQGLSRLSCYVSRKTPPHKQRFSLATHYPGTNLIGARSRRPRTILR